MFATAGNHLPRPVACDGPVGGDIGLNHRGHDLQLHRPVTLRGLGMPVAHMVVFVRLPLTQRAEVGIQRD